MMQYGGRYCEGYLTLEVAVCTQGLLSPKIYGSLYGFAAVGTDGHVLSTDRPIVGVELSSGFEPYIISTVSARASGKLHSNSLSTSRA